MGLRPTPARWFELLTSRDDLPAVLDGLAGTGAVELQTHSETRAPMVLPDLGEYLDEFATIAHRYGAYWPPSTAAPAVVDRDPEALSDQALSRLRAWVEMARPRVERLQVIDREVRDLNRLTDWVRSSAALPRLDLLASRSPALDAALVALDPGAALATLPPGVLSSLARGAAGNYVLALGKPEAIASLRETAVAAHGRTLTLPAWLPAEREAAEREIERRLAELATERQRVAEELDAGSERWQLAQTIAEFAFLEWLMTHVPSLPVTEHFAWVTGWTSDPTGREISDVLDGRDLRFLLRFPKPPAGLERPMLLANPAWARPFELFTRLLGVPGAQGADPSRVVAVVAPLMFGYMFGDVGQGFVLLVVGLALRRRFPALGLLVSGGLVSMVFGVMFGSVFALEGLIPALWLQPLERPVPLLVTTVIFGAGLLLLGLLLSAMQSFWQGRTVAWLASDAGITVTYLGILGAFVDRLLLVLIPVGALWCVIGSSLQHRGAGLGAVGQALADLLETVLQLVVNTLSFARVGAFALAHAGLSAATVGVAEATPGPAGFALVLVLGNLLIMTLEALVVAVQTTRLVLFEFFIRFLDAAGRPFRPLTGLASE